MQQYPDTLTLTARIIYLQTKSDSALDLTYCENNKCRYINVFDHSINYSINTQHDRYCLKIIKNL